MVKTPPLKTQGIKTKLVPLILHSTSWHGNGRWIEPFLGSGVVLFNLAPARAVIADTNEHIIEFYCAVKNGKITPQSVRAFLFQEGRALQDSQGEYYYEVRERFNQRKAPLDFLFLNRACFNGLMRFNSRGGFNVPFCRKPDRFSPAYITKICNQVAWAGNVMRDREWRFCVQDWRVTLNEARDGDFIYLDPPYNDRHTDYYNKWSADNADALALDVKELSTKHPNIGFAYSTWKQNEYRVNDHLPRHFADYPIVTTTHFYHVGSTEDLRHAMEEALVIAPGYTANGHQSSAPLPALQQELPLFA